MVVDWVSAVIVPIGMAAVHAVFKAGRVTQKVNGLEASIAKIDSAVGKVDAKVERLVDRFLETKGSA